MKLPWRRRAAQAVDLVDDGSLVTVGRAYEVERGDRVVVAEMAAAGVDLGRPVLVRHRFAVAGDPAELLARLAAEGWDTVADGDGVVARRTQLVTELGAAQARARMTGLEMRVACTYLGWEVAVSA